MAVKPIVLLIHGMGTHNSGGITEEVRRGLKECSTFFDVDSFDPDSEFDFKEFNYSEYLDEKRQEMGDEAEALTQYLSAGPQLIQKIVNLQAKLKEDGFLYTHWLDVVMYCLFGTLRETILSRCMETVLSTLKEAKDTPTNIRPVVILAHSLGTAVMHDALTKLVLKSNEPDRPNHIKFANYAIDGLWMVANVSRMTHLLTRLEDPDHSIVRDHNDDNEGVSYLYYPVYNQYDPFTVFKRYSLDPQWGDLIRTNEIRRPDGTNSSINPHSLTEYLADPEVGGEFLSQFSTLSFSLAQRQEAKQKYRKTTLSGPISDHLEAIKKAIRDLESQIGTAGTSLSLVKALIELYELISDAYKLIEEKGPKK